VEFLLILRALRHNRVGALLIALQIALTLAIVCNSLSVIQEYIRHMRTPSGVDEANIIVVDNSWVRQPSDLKARITADLNALRSLPSVVGVVATNAVPLGGSGWSTGIGLKPARKEDSAQTTEYFVDEHGLAAYGLRLIAGRWFTEGEISDLLVGASSSPNYSPPSAVLTRKLAAVLFPAGNALGQVVYINPATPTRTVGIVEQAQTPWASVGWGQSPIENSVFLPYRFLSGNIEYVIRTRSGALTDVLHAIPDALYSVTRQRIIARAVPFEQVRQQAYLSERSLSVTLGILCGLLMVTTACSIVGLTMYWVAQRRRQIGMRRALGARRIDILRYFHTENLLIAGGGTLLGVVVGLAGNMWLASVLALTRMSADYLVAGTLIVLGLCQLAVLWPAIRAASIPPASAIRIL
jgi:putative ABC transport system permease protein